MFIEILHRATTSLNILEKCGNQWAKYPQKFSNNFNFKYNIIQFYYTMICRGSNAGEHSTLGSLYSWPDEVSKAMHGKTIDVEVADGI